MDQKHLRYVHVLLFRCKQCSEPLARHQVIRLAIARKITSCIFIARSQATLPVGPMPSSGWYSYIGWRRQSGHFIC